MAFIPDQAIDRMTELSAGGWRLYTFLARCRNQKSGKCNPSVITTMEAIGVNRSSVYALRKELSGKSWAIFDGDSAIFLLGFNSPNNQTIETTNKSIKPNSPEIQTHIDNQKSESKNSDSGSPDNQTISTEEEAVSRILTGESEKSDLNAESPKIQTEQSKNSDSESKNSDCYIGRTSKHEPAKGTSKSKDMSNSRSTEIEVVFGHWKSVLDHPRAVLDEKRKSLIRARLASGFSVEDLKLAIDGCRASPFHQGDNERRQVYDGIELIFRDASKVEQFMSYAVRPPPTRNGHLIHGPPPISRQESNRAAIAGAKKKLFGNQPIIDQELEE